MEESLKVSRPAGVHAILQCSIKHTLERAIALPTLPTTSIDELIEKERCTAIVFGQLELLGELLFSANSFPSVQTSQDKDILLQAVKSDFSADQLKSVEAAFDYLTYWDANR